MMSIKGNKSAKSVTILLDKLISIGFVARFVGRFSLDAAITATSFPRVPCEHTFALFYAGFTRMFPGRSSERLLASRFPLVFPGPTPLFRGYLGHEMGQAHTKKASFPRKTHV